MRARFITLSSTWCGTFGRGESRAGSLDAGWGGCQGSRVRRVLHLLGVTAKRRKQSPSGTWEKEKGAPEDEDREGFESRATAGGRGLREAVSDRDREPGGQR